MTDERPNRSPAARTLDRLVEEVRERDRREVSPSSVDRQGRVNGQSGVDWSGLEERVMAAVEREKPALLRDVESSHLGSSHVESSHVESSHVESSHLESAHGRWRSRDGLLRGVAVFLAAAAAVALFVRKDERKDAIAVLADPGVVPVEGASASSLRTTEGGGEVRINRVVATPGYVVRAGDTIEVEGARAVFERTRKVTWLLEGTTHPDGAPRDPGRAARAHVKVAGQPLVVSLDNGAVEAQVTPVATGEAFAVDVGTNRGVVRIAVHGTHLRVARTGTRVTVDLTEGVVSIGVPPRTGVTYGTLVTAPAHVEFDAADPDAYAGSLKVTHEPPEAVRAAVALGPLGPHDALVVGRVDAPPPVVLVTPPHATAAAVAKGSSPRLDSVTVVKAEALRAPRDAIANAVRECAAARGRSGDVHVTVTSNLNLHVSAAGEVETAQFSPPLLPEIQSCAAHAIYRTKLDEFGLVTIPIEYSY